MLDRQDLDPWLLFIAVAALVSAAWISYSVLGAHKTRRVNPAELLGIGAIAAVAGVHHYGFGTMLWPFFTFLALAAAMSLASSRLSMPGIAWLAIDFMGVATGWFWSCLFIAGLDIPGALKFIALLCTLLMLGIAVLAAFERVAREAIFTHAFWQQPNRAFAPAPRMHSPKVSVHLPCYAEPPSIVMETMNRLAALDYPNYEVLVCDNNTRDESLWRPLERHAQTLNRRLGEERFRFFHVAPLDGAKAGALNWLFQHTAPDAELVAVIDADYYSEPDFLSRLTPFFDNPRIAYIQTPHDYRDYENSAYLRSCYAEYMPNNKIDMLGVHEYGGAFTIGTMCIIRLAPLKRVGGWAEWCLTEDSEVSVRLRAAGYEGVYLGETFGRGLIPSNFDDYKKQRFRWTAGPVQQLRRHWRLFLPTPWARRMPGWTKVLEVLRCSAPLQVLTQVVTSLVVIASVLIAVATGVMKPIDLPDIMWVLLPLAAATTLVRTWHRYRIAGTHRIGDMVRGEVARAALSYVILLGGIAGLSSKPLAWRRTPKFERGGDVAGALAPVVPEIVLGIAGLVLAAAMAVATPLVGWEFALISAFGLLFYAARFLCAPYLALLALKDTQDVIAAPAISEPDVAEEAPAAA